MQTNNTYTTTHNTAERTMEIEMEAGFNIFVDWKSQIVATTRDGKIKDLKRFEDMPSLADFEKYIENVENAAKQLNRQTFMISDKLHTKKTALELLQKMKYTIVRKRTIDELKNTLVRRQTSIIELLEVINIQTVKIAILEKTIADLKFNERDRKGCFTRNKTKKQTT